MRYHLTLAALLTLAGCGSEPAASDPEQAAAEAPEDATTRADSSSGAVPSVAASDARLSPGQWEMTTEMLEMSAPGMPAGALPKGTTATNIIRTCIEEQQSERPDAGFFTGRQDPGCTYQDFSMASGRIRGTVTCDSQGGPMKMTMDGRHSSDSYDLTMTMASDRMNMKMRTQGKRIGECPAS